MFRTMLVATLTVMLVVAGFAAVVPSADAQCPKEGCPPPPPPKEGVCHNIGGPRDLGANCDMTGNCSFQTDTLGVITVDPNHFLGIIISFNQDSNALAAHLAHGDGPIVMTFTPALHLASTGQNHQASNVECLGLRVIPQPNEPGN